MFQSAITRVSHSNFRGQVSRIGGWRSQFQSAITRVSHSNSLWRAPRERGFFVSIRYYSRLSFQRSSPATEKCLGPVSIRYYSRLSFQLHGAECGIVYQLKVSIRYYSRLSFQRHSAGGQSPGWLFQSAITRVSHSNKIIFLLLACRIAKFQSAITRVSHSNWKTTHVYECWSWVSIRYYSRLSFQPPYYFFQNCWTHKVSIRYYSRLSFQPVCSRRHWYLATFQSAITRVSHSNF